MKNLLGDWEILYKYGEELREIARLIKSDREIMRVFPSSDNVFRAFHQCEFKKLKVVIVKQSTYADDYNDGLAFSQNSYMDANKSSNNFVDAMDKQFYQHGSFPFPENDLTYLAKQGVLLLNRELTITDSRRHTFWLKFTDKVIEELRLQNVIIISFGCNISADYQFNSFKEFQQSKCLVEINNKLPNPINWI